jgi:hypothetical protein
MLGDGWVTKNIKRNKHAPPRTDYDHQEVQAWLDAGGVHKHLIAKFPLQPIDQSAYHCRLIPTTIANEYRSSHVRGHIEKVGLMVMLQLEP